MLKKLLSLVLILLSGSLINVAPVYGVQSSKNQVQTATKIKQKINKLGVEHPIKLKLNDGRKLIGRIGEINDDNFIFLAGAKGDRMTVDYSQVKQVKDDLNSGGANLLPGFLIAAGVIALIKIIH